MHNKKYIALLRAVNIGKNQIKMAELQQAFVDMGFGDVKTHIQTGNVIFTTSEPRSGLVKKIETGLTGRFGWPVKIFLYDKSELETAIKNCPYSTEGNMQVQLLFLSDEPSKENVGKIMKFQEPEYKFFVKNNIFYYTYGKAWAGKRRTINFEKILDVEATGRNLNVTKKLIELAS
jgi:uncharacterized protein (DUF1697 family)